MVAVRPGLNGGSKAIRAARHLPPQFARDAWRLSAFLIVAGLAYAAYQWSPDVGWFLVSAAHGSLPVLTPVSESVDTAFVTCFRALATVGIVLAICRLLPATPATFGFAKPRLAHVWVVLKAWSVTWVTALVLQFQLNRANGVHMDPSIAALAHHKGTIDYWSEVIGSSIATPLVEETLFRGLLFAALAQWVPVWLAALVSSLAFALWHQEPYSTLTLTVMGLGLAYIYYRSGTLWAPMAAHAFNNWVVVSVTFWANSFGS